MQQLNLAAQYGLPAAAQNAQLYKAQTAKQEAPTGDKSASFGAKLTQAKEGAAAPADPQGTQVKDADAKHADAKHPDTAHPDGGPPGEAPTAHAPPPDQQEEAPPDAASEAALWVGAPVVVMLTQTAQAPAEGETAQETGSVTESAPIQLPQAQTPAIPQDSASNPDPAAAQDFAQVLGAQRQEGMSILQRPAEDAAETNPLPIPQDDAVIQAGFTDESVQTAKAVVGEALARMPNAQQETIQGDAGQALGTLSSLENVHTTDQKAVSDAEVAPPPSRVEITAQPAPRADTGADTNADADTGSDADTAQYAAPDTREEGVERLATKTENAFQAQDARPALGPEAAGVAPQQAQEAPPPPAATQIVEEAQIQQAMGRTDFTMRLKPESLGEVTVRITMVGDDVTARIVTRTEGARAAIAGELAALGDAMRERGIDVRGVQVVDGSMDQASLLHDGNGGRGRQQGGQPRRRASAPAAAAAVAEITQGYNLYAMEAPGDVSGVEISA